MELGLIHWVFLFHFETVVPNPTFTLLLLLIEVQGVINKNLKIQSTPLWWTHCPETWGQWSAYSYQTGAQCCIKPSEFSQAGSHQLCFITSQVNPDSQKWVAVFTDVYFESCAHHNQMHISKSKVWIVLNGATLLVYFYLHFITLLFWWL